MLYHIVGFLVKEGIETVKIPGVMRIEMQGFLGPGGEFADVLRDAFVFFHRARRCENYSALRCA
jgi:hypothetical protein